jgi:monovalent cation/hydrogen antiporter
VTHVLIFLVAATLVVVALEWVAEKTGLPAAALLTIAGLIYAFLPGANITLDPHVILEFILPPLLYSAALNSSLIAIRRNLRTVVSLSVFLVLATAALVGVGVHLLIPAIPLAAAVALGAAVAPPDPVAALAIGRRAGLPPRLITLIEGEGLLNDATALTTFTVAIAAVTSGFNAGQFGLNFFIATIGGIAVGIAIALILRFSRRFFHESLMVNSLSLVTPFAAYLAAESIHGSGVLAVVVAGLIIGHGAPKYTTGNTRLQSGAIWRLIDFALEGFVFILIGQQLPHVLTGLSEYSTSTIVAAAVLTVAIVLLLRPVWLIVTQMLPRPLHARLGARGNGEDAGDTGTKPDRGLNAKEMLVMSWAGTRGVITLAAIFSMPEDFPGRNLLILCAYMVVLVTLVGQGITFAPVVRATGIRADAAAEAKERNEARIAATQAGLSALDDFVETEGLDADDAKGLKDGLEVRLDRYQRRTELLDQADDGQVPSSARYDAALAARRAVLDAEREELLRWRDAGRLTDAALRVLQRELDVQEQILPKPNH